MAVALADDSCRSGFSMADSRGNAICGMSRSDGSSMAGPCGSGAEAGGAGVMGAGAVGAAGAWARADPAPRATTARSELILKTILIIMSVLVAELRKQRQSRSCAP